MKVFRCAVFGISLVSVASGWAQSPVVGAAKATGQIQGQVTAAKGGAAVGDVVVSTYRISPSPVVLGEAIAAKDGTFNITGLPSGHYNVCVLDKSQAFINPCDWLEPNTQIDVTDGKESGPLNLSLKAATVLQVHVNDPGNALTATARDATPPRVLVTIRGVVGAGMIAVEANRTATGVDYQMRVPFDTPLKLQITSKVVALETAAHAAVPPSGLTQDVLLESAKTQQPAFVFNTTGRNP